MRPNHAILVLAALVFICGCGGSSSAIAQVAAPVFSPAPGTYSTTQTVTMSEMTAGAAIYYTTNGYPPSTKSMKYTGPIQVASSQIIQAIAVSSASAVSTTAVGDYNIVAPSVSASSFNFGQNLIYKSVTETVATVTNSGPTAAPVSLSILGNNAFSLVPAQSCGAQIAANSSCPVVVAFNPTYPGPASTVVGVHFTGGAVYPFQINVSGTAIEATTATPQFSLAPGAYSTGQSVSITDATPGAGIYYTTDGSTPTTHSRIFSSSAPVYIYSSSVLKAIAVAAHQNTSAVAEAEYTLVPPFVSTNAFDFGSNPLSNTLTRSVALVVNDGPTAAPVGLSIHGQASFTLVPAQSCGATVAANSSCPIVVAFDPTRTGTQTTTVSVNFPGVSAPTYNINVTGETPMVPSGTVTGTINPQVANYSITPPYPGSVVVEFGPTTSYGYSTSAVSTPTTGGTVNILVAGMIAKTEYHMRAIVTFENGAVFTDTDHTFMTGSVPAGILPALDVTTTPGLTPQPGIELVDDVLGATGSYVAFASDLQGNVIWTYEPPDAQKGTTYLYPIKLLPNGHMIMELGPISQAVQAAPPAPGTLIALREIDLAGNIVRQLTMTQLNQKLVAAGFTNLNLLVYTHDVTPLPNGHTLVITNMVKPYTNVTGFPGTTNVLGDVVVDLDENWNPVWVWSEFDHFDVNRHPYMFPDWTHSNALIYSKDDGNFLVSIRHQNWVVKVNYQDGMGDGSVLWRLGYQGDFTLKNGTDPQDWFYAQHNPAFFSSNTSGSFLLSVMDNGDDRVFPGGQNCDVQAGNYCYTTIPVMQVDETAKTATLTFHQQLPGNLYSFFAGDVLLLPNNNIEFNLAGLTAGSDIFEETYTTTPQTVWEMHLVGEDTYRAFRIPSLYPGVTW